MDDYGIVAYTILLLEGDAESASKIIDAYIPLAKGLANKYSNNNAEQRDELTQIAICALIEAVRKIQSGEKQLYNLCIGKYLSVTMKGKVLNSLNKPKIRDLYYTFATFKQDLPKEYCKTDLEIQLVKLKLENYTYREIAKKVNLPVVIVFRKLRIIGERIRRDFYGCQESTKISKV